MFIDNTTPLGVSFAYGNASGVTNIFTAASNTNGVIIRSMEIAAGCLVVADTSAPSGYDDSSKRVILWTTNEMGLLPVFFPYPILIPAGNGLWIAVASGFSPGYAITYDPVSA